MNDTHGVKGKGWYGFDLDGTLAKYDKWQGIDHIGEPVKPMVDLMKRMHAEGKVVRILTARVAPRTNTEYRPNPYYDRNTLPDLKNRELFSDAGYKMLYGLVSWDARGFVTDWCRENLGFIPEITHEKDHLMITLFDDRVKQVLPNKGDLVEDLYMDLGKKFGQMYADNGWLVAKLESKRNGFWAGFMLAFLLYILVGAGVKAYDTWFGPEKEPARIRMEKAHDVLCDLLRDWPVECKEVK